MHIVLIFMNENFSHIDVQMHSQDTAQAFAYQPVWQSSNHHIQEFSKMPNW